MPIYLPQVVSSLILPITLIFNTSKTHSNETYHWFGKGIFAEMITLQEDLKYRECDPFKFPNIDHA